MQEFIIKNSISRAEYSNLILKRAYKQPMYKVLTVAGILMLCVAILASFNLIEMQDASDPPIFQFLMGLFVLALPFLTKIQAGKIYDRSQILKGEVTYTFSDLEIHSQGLEFSNTNSWNLIIKRQEIGNYILLFTDISSAIILNKKNLSPEQLNFIRNKKG
jgi:hypothetical protein